MPMDSQEDSSLDDRWEPTYSVLAAAETGRKTLTRVFMGPSWCRPGHETAGDYVGFKEGRAASVGCRRV